jgi:hypothetical protein
MDGHHDVALSFNNGKESFHLWRQLCLLCSTVKKAIDDVFYCDEYILWFKVKGTLNYRSWGSSGSIVSGYGQDDRAIEVRSQVGEREFSPSVSRLALGPTQVSCTMATGVFSRGLMRSRSVTLTTHPHLVPRSLMSRSYTSSHPCASMGVLWDCFTFYVELYMCLLHELVSDLVFFNPPRFSGSSAISIRQN